MIRNCLTLAIVLFFSIAGALAALEILSWGQRPVVEPCVVLCFVEAGAVVACSSTCSELSGGALDAG